MGGLGWSITYLPIQAMPPFTTSRPLCCNANTLHTDATNPCCKKLQPWRGKADLV